MPSDPGKDKQKKKGSLMSILKNKRRKRQIAEVETAPRGGKAAVARRLNKENRERNK